MAQAPDGSSRRRGRGPERADQDPGPWEDLRPQSRRSWLHTSLLHEKLHLREEAAKRAERAPELAAHLHEQAVPLPSPDATCALRDVFAAVSWLLEQVPHPERRTVAGWGIWRTLVAEEVSFEALAEMLGIPHGTFVTHWDRAKGDMRAALERERAKSRGRSRLAALIAALAAVGFWLVARGRRVAGALAGAPLRLDPSRPARARQHRASLVASSLAAVAGGGPVRLRGAGPRVALACVGLPLAVLSHVPFNAALSSAEVFAASYEAIAGEATREVHAVREVDRSMYGPILTTNAEREREWGAGHDAVITAQAGAAGTRAAVLRGRAAAPDELPRARGLEVDPAEAQFARGFLTRALAAIGQGELDVARDVLRAYDLAVHDGSFSSERARLGALLSAAERSP